LSRLRTPPLLCINGQRRPSSFYSVSYSALTFSITGEEPRATLMGELIFCTEDLKLKRKYNQILKNYTQDPKEILKTQSAPSPPRQKHDGRRRRCSGQDNLMMGWPRLPWWSCSRAQWKISERGKKILEIEILNPVGPPLWLLGMEVEEHVARAAQCGVVTSALDNLGA
jgi:hypothetical protein